LGTQGRRLALCRWRQVKATTGIWMGSWMNWVSRLAAVTLAALMCSVVPASAQSAPPPDLPPPQRAPDPNYYGPDELVGAGHRFFGNVSRGLASVIERAVSQWGLPNGYVLGEEGSGAFVAGLRYGEGTLYTKNAGDLRVYWQGPSVGSTGVATAPAP